MNNMSNQVLTYNPHTNTVETVTTTVSYENALPISNGTFLKCFFNNSRHGLYTIDNVASSIISTYPDAIYQKVFARASSATFFLTTDGKLYASGENAKGQLGIANNKQRISFPTLVDTSLITNLNAGSITDVANGYNISFILTSSGRVFYTQNSTLCEMSLTLFVNANAGSVTQISTMLNLTLFLTSSGKASVDSKGGAAPVLVNTTNIEASGVITSVSAGDAHGLLLRSDGKVFAFGRNSSGQCGSNTSGVTISVPTEIALTNIITQISGGFSYSLFLTNEGTVLACGNNWYGQLGTNTTLSENIFTPTNVNGTIVKISASRYHSAFLTTTHKAYTWGLNNHGQLGKNGARGSSAIEVIPTLVVTTNLTTENSYNITDVYAGEYHTTLFAASTGKAFASRLMLNSQSGGLGTLDRVVTGAPDNTAIPIRTVVSNLQGYSSGIFMDNGKVLLIPSTKRSSVQILGSLNEHTAATPAIYNPITNQITLGVTNGSGYSGGVILPNNKVVFVPHTATTIGLYDPTTTPNTFTTLSNGVDTVAVSY